jgi:hypothetical protein
MNNNTSNPTKDLKSTERFSYLLHVWRTNGQWRASLEVPGTGKRIGFANLEQLFAYLMDLIEGNSNKQTEPERTRTDSPGKSM